MKRTFYLVFLILIPITMFGKNQGVTIHGKVFSNDIKELEIRGFSDYPINGIAKSYTLPIDDNGAFSKNIPISKSYESRILAGMGTAKSINFQIFLIPGDDIDIIINNTELQFSGKGSEKLNFLIELYELADNFKQRRKDFLKNYQGFASLEESFIRYFYDKTNIEYLNLITNLFKNAFYTDRNIEPYLKKYEKDIQVSNYTNDELVNYSSYISNIRNYIFYVKNRQIQYMNNSISFSEGKNIALMDSLNGITRDYALAEYICKDLSDNEYDTLMINTFHDIANNKFAKEIIDKELKNHELRKMLIDKPLHKEFALTNLADTANMELTFKEMLDKNKGNVVYLEIWSLGCGPCRKAMPISREIEQELAPLPVKFVYLTSDRYHQKLWEHIFNASLTKDNHYRLTAGSQSRINKFMNSTAVPWYMLFDKQGKLKSFKAEDPYSIKETLIELSRE
jgi:thiol-disulfide isomerase/thioredoxin